MPTETNKSTPSVAAPPPLLVPKEGQFTIAKTRWLKTTAPPLPTTAARHKVEHYTSPCAVSAPPQPTRTSALPGPTGPPHADAAMIGLRRSAGGPPASSKNAGQRPALRAPPISELPYVRSPIHPIIRRSSRHHARNHTTIPATINHEIAPVHREQFGTRYALRQDHQGRIPQVHLRIFAQ